MESLVSSSTTTTWRLSSGSNASPLLRHGVGMRLPFSPSPFLSLRVSCATANTNTNTNTNASTGRNMNTNMSASANKDKKEAWEYQKYEALLRGGQEITVIMQEMIDLLQDLTGVGTEAEDFAVEIAAASIVGQHLDNLDESFIMAIDLMIKQAESDHDEKRKGLLQIIKDCVLHQLSQKCPSQVQVVGMLCQMPTKEQRQVILRRSVGGGGVFTEENDGRLAVPFAKLDEIAAQADDFIASMEEKSKLVDRKLLAKLVLAREEARAMMGGGILDTRNDNRGFRNLPESEVKFLSKLVSMKPGPMVRKRISNVMRGNDEGADLAAEEEAQDKKSKKKDGKLFPVRPGMFLETVTKVLADMYEKNVGGVAVQQLEWIHRETLEILEELAFH